MKFYYSPNQLKCATRFIFKNNDKIRYGEQQLEEIIYEMVRNYVDLIGKTPDRERSSIYVVRKFGFVITFYRMKNYYDVQITVEPNIKVGGEYKSL